MARSKILAAEEQARILSATLGRQYFVYMVDDRVLWVREGDFPLSEFVGKS